LSVTEIANRVVTSINALKTTMPDLSPRHRSIEARLPVPMLCSRQRSGEFWRALLFFAAAGIEGLSLLVHRALLRQQGKRYTMHELIRQFALHKLEQSGDKTTAERAHAAYYLRLLTSHKSDLYGPQPLTAIRQLRPERENLHKHSRYREACTHWQKALAISLELEDRYAIAMYHNNFRRRFA